MAADPIGKSVGPVKLKVGVPVPDGSGCKLKFDHFLNAIKWKIKQITTLSEQFKNVIENGRNKVKINTVNTYLHFGGLVQGTK